MVKENRGGKREGAGRKKIKRQYSDALKSDIDKHVRLKAKETGKSYGRVLCDLAWDEDIAPQFRSPYLKLIADIQCVKESHAKVDVVNHNKPQIYLPEVMPKPQEAADRETEIQDRLH